MELNSRSGGQTKSANVFSKSSAKIALANGYEEDDLVNGICQVCVTEDAGEAIEVFHRASEAEWQGDLQKAVMDLANDEA